VDATGIDPDLLAAVPTEAFTIHRCLGANPDRPTRFRHDARHPLPADVVVVDEASMIDFGLMARLADAVRPEARLVLLGDRNQLASVEAGAVFGDVCDAGAAGGAVRDCVVRLRRPYRFRADGGIGALARAVNEDRPDDALACLRSGAPDLAFVPVPAGADPGATAVRAEVATAWGKGLREAVAAIVDAADAASHAAAVLRAFEHLDRFRVLCIHRRGPRGVEAANRVIPSWIHGRDAENVAGAAGTAGDWYPGLPVMVLRNDYRLDLANGDVGIVLPGFAEDRALLAHFPTADGGVRAFARGRLPPHEPVHAMTVHKSPGSQFGTVLLLLPEEPSPLVTRELVYTAVTRARDRVVVAGSEAVLAAAIRLPIRRASGLKAKL
jgi:exodeoxyribonuclease V alpha subunit